MYCSCGRDRIHVRLSAASTLRMHIYQELELLLLPRAVVSVTVDAGRSTAILDHLHPYWVLFTT